MGMDRFDFLNPYERLITQDDIPPTPPTARVDHVYDMKAGQQFRIYADDKQGYNDFVVNQCLVVSGNGSRRTVLMTQIGTRETLSLTDWQLAYLERKGRIRPVGVRTPDRSKLPGSALSLTSEELATALRYRHYLDAVFAKYERHNNGRGSRELLRQAIAEVAEERGEEPPSVSTIYEKIGDDRRGGFFDPLMNLAPLPRPGNRRDLGRRVEDAIEEAIHEALVTGGNSTDIPVILRNWTKEGGKYADMPNLVDKKDGVGPLVSQKTLERRLAGLDAYTRDFLYFGGDYAERAHKTYVAQNRPLYPLDIVDVDHTTLPVVVCDDERGIGFGRPDLIVFRDRYSGIVLGFAISLSSPSYATFLEGMLHMLTPKDPDTLPDGVAYPWSGRPTKLGVDNAKHLVGLPIREAAMSLGFATVAYRPGHPWEKGALEHFFHVLGVQAVNRMPGATGMSADERKKYDEDRMMALPQVTLEELRGILSDYFANIYHQHPHEGLGEISTFSGVSAERWAEGVKKTPPRPLTDLEGIVRLASDFEMVGIGKLGVRWDHLIYQSPALSRLKLDGRHKKGSGKHQGTKYKAFRDPSDLGRIWVQNPYRKNEVIEVPVADSMARYANGLRLYQHERIVKHNREMKREAGNVEQLLKSRGELQEKLAEVHRKRQKQGTATLLARFISRQARHVSRSERVVMPEGSGVKRMNVVSPTRSRPERKLASSARAILPESDAYETAAPQDAAVTSPAVDRVGKSTAAPHDPVRHERFDHWED